MESGGCVPGPWRTRAFSGRGRHILTAFTIQVSRDDDFLMEARLSAAIPESLG